MTSLLFLAAHACHPVFAENTMSIPKSAASLDELARSIEEREPIGWELGIESSSFVSWKNHPENDRNPYGVTFAVDKRFEYKSFDLGVSGHTYLSMNQPLLNYSHVDEFNFGFRNVWGADELKVGRYRQSWSTVDSFWRLGAWQPLFLWNYVKPEEQGLAGLFFRFKKSNWVTDVFASPIFIPSQGPSFVLHDGNFESSNPWFSIPTQQLIIGSGKAILKYNLHTPNASDIVLNPSLGFNVKHIDDSDKTWVTVGAAYKPINQLGMGLKDNFFLPTSQVDVELYPYVQYHYLATAEVGYHFASSDAMIGMIADVPKDVTLPSDQSGALFQRSLVISPMYVYHVKNGGLKSITAAYLYRDSSAVNYVGDPQVAAAALGLDRYFFKNAVSLAFAGKIFRKIPLDAVLRSAYDLEFKGALITCELSYKPSAHWNIAAGMEVIGADEAVADPRNPFYQYRSNDRVYGGISYVF